MANLPPGSQGHILGTDNLGRDLIGLLLWGARTSLLVGLCSAFCAVTIGSLWGAISALSRPFMQAVMMRVVDILLSVPNIILLLVIDALVLELPWQKWLPNNLANTLGITNYSNGFIPLLTIIIVISSTTWLEVSRLTAARIKTIMSDQYVEAAVTNGLDFWQIIFKHLLPNAANIIVLEGTLLVADAILSEAGLSFLGLGLGPNMPSWGSMLNGAQKNIIAGNWWSALAPGLFITLTVFAIQMTALGKSRTFTVRLKAQ